jgi:GNAT superfamily N-acetyltransferase
VNELLLRPAVPDDVPLILHLIHQLALFEREPAAVLATEADLMRDGFGPEPHFYCVIAEWQGVAAGFALWFHNYSTWRGHSGIHLEDLFVLPEYPGRGIGKALLTRVAAIAHAEGCPRLEWNVLDWNLNAIDFYHRMGAEMQGEWRIMSLLRNSLLNSDR